MNGSNAERRLCAILRSGGWHAHRAGASGGGTDADLPDLAAAKSGVGVAIELKSSKGERVYLDADEIEALERYAVAFGLRAAVGVRWSGERAFYLYDPSTLHRTDAGKYRVHRRDGAGFVFRDPAGSSSKGLAPKAVDGQVVTESLAKHAALCEANTDE